MTRSQASRPPATPLLFVLLGQLVITALAFCAAVPRVAEAGPLFATKTDYGTASNPISVAIEDLNGDGKLDLATANYISNTVSVLLGTGDGTFGARTDFETGREPYSLVIGDLNGDGKPDLATANKHYSTVSVLLGNGNGTFGARTDFGTGTEPSCVAIGDLNGDGKPDLATANEVPNTVSVLLGDGNGTFGAKTDFDTGTNPYSMAIGDVSGDGKLDLVTANYSDPGSVSVLLGNGDGTFGAKTDFGTGGAVPYSVSIADLNGDGKPDLATSNWNAPNGTVSMLLGNGNGTFGAKTTFRTGSGPRSVTIGDLNGDGRPDLTTANYISNTVSVLLNTGGAGRTITASAGGGGTISPSGAVVVNPGSNRTFTITPDTGYNITDVLVDGVSVGAVSSYTFPNVQADHSITSSFGGLPDLVLDSLQVVQPVVSPNLVRGKSTVVRAYFHNAGQQLSVAVNIAGRLHVTNASGTELYPPRMADRPVVWPAGDATFGNGAIQAGEQTLNFYLSPSDVDYDELRFWVEIDALNAMAESNESNNDNFAAPQAQHFYTAKPLRIGYYTVSSRDKAGDHPDLGGAADLLFKIYPARRDNDGWQYLGHLKWSHQSVVIAWDQAAQTLLWRQLNTENVSRIARGQPRLDRVVGFFEDWPFGNNVGGRTFMGAREVTINANRLEKQQAVAHEMGHSYRLNGEAFLCPVDLVNELCPSSQRVASDADYWDVNDCAGRAFPCQNHPAQNRVEGLLAGRYVDRASIGAFDVDGKRPAGWARPEAGQWKDKAAPRGVTAVFDAKWWLHPTRVDTFKSGVDPALASSNRRIGFMGSLLGDAFAWTTNDDYELLAAKMLQEGSQPQDAEHLAIAAVDSEQVWITASIDSTGQVDAEPWWSIRTALPTDVLEGTGYSVDMLGAANTVLASYPFGLSFTQSATPSLLTRLPLPAGTRTIVIRQDALTLFTRSVSAAAPTVHLDTPNGGALAGNVTVQWTAQDADNDSLSASLFYSPDGGATWLVLATGLATSTYTWSVDSVAGTRSGTLRVYVTDGVNTTYDTSDSGLVIGGKLPLAHILAPTDRDTLIAGSAVEFRGSLFDPEDGYASGANLSWSSSIAGPLASGDHFTLSTLQPGMHTIVVVGQDTDGNGAQDSVHVLVVADTDRDGMPDAWELLYATLNPAVADGNRDADDDSLSNREEYAWGTNPMNRDTDGDGFSDGLEVQIGSDPISAGSTPVSVKTVPGSIPLKVGVLSYPNPFRSSAVIRYELPSRRDVDLTVHDIQGRLVRRLARGTHEAGIYNVGWDGRSDDGTGVAAGIYFLRLKTGAEAATFRTIRLH